MDLVVHPRCPKRREPAARCPWCSPILQACDLWFDHFTGYGIPGYEGTCAVHVNKRKKDRIRRGHHPALGRAEDPELDIVHQLRVWMEAMDLVVHPRCRKRHEPAARCPWCPPIFPRTRRGRGNVTVSDGYACSPQRMSDDVKFAMSQMGAELKPLRGRLCAQRGLPTAIEACIHEAVLFMQTGHGQAKQQESICISGTRRSSCKSSGRLNCDSCVSR